ncbi:MAG TPA: hypothetical protein VLA43_01700 [Longimicrobiales bacterium]|nr:hypothetical protein [Longimicrobiales bacterium]
MGVFEFVILIVLISTFGKVVAQRGSRLPPPQPRDEPRLPPGEIQELRDTLDRMDERLARIEEERDFYRKLLDDPRRKEGDLPSP